MLSSGHCLKGLRCTILGGAGRFEGVEVPGFLSGAGGLEGVEGPGPLSGAGGFEGVEVRGQRNNQDNTNDVDSGDNEDHR